jgi:hypothetical protein
LWLLAKTLKNNGEYSLPVLMDAAGGVSMETLSNGVKSADLEL